MGIIDSIASASMTMSSMKVASQVSMSVLKGAMEQNSENLMKILEGVENLAPLPESNIDISI